MEKWLHFSDKKGLQLWLDSLEIQSKQTVKQWLDFSDKKGFQLWSDFHQIQAKESFKQRLDFLDKKDCQYGRICFGVRLKNL